MIALYMHPGLALPLLVLYTFLLAPAAWLNRLSFSLNGIRPYSVPL